MVPGGKSFYHFDAFCPRSRPYHEATITKSALLSLFESISPARKFKMRHCKCEKPPHNVDNAGKDCGLWTILICAAGNLLGRFYCLQVANRQMYTVTANLPINR